MTVKEIIEYTDKVRPNGFDLDTKLFWIDQVEGIIQSEIFRIPLESIKRVKGEGDTLSVPHPYAQIYSLYIISMIELFLGDAAKYEVSAKAYNLALKSYAKLIARGGV